MVPIQISQEQKASLSRGVAEGKTYVSLAGELGVCVDTLKRILTREGIASFQAAKYTPAPKTDTWTRPCMKCRSTNPRPRNLYFCDDCRPTSSSGYEI